MELELGGRITKASGTDFFFHQEQLYVIWIEIAK